MTKRDVPTGVESPQPTQVEVVGRVSILPVRLERPVKIEPPTSDQWAGLTIAVPTDRPVQVLGDQLQRARVILRNLAGADGDAIVLGTGHEVQRRTGYVLQPGAELELRNNQAIYALTDGADPVELTVVVEHAR